MRKYRKELGGLRKPNKLFPGYRHNISNFDTRYIDADCFYFSFQTVQQSPEASPTINDLHRLLDSSQDFRTRWSETDRNLTTLSSFMKNRLAIYNEWYSNVNVVSDWLARSKLPGNNSLNSSNNSSTLSLSFGIEVSDVILTFSAPL